MYIKGMKIPKVGQRIIRSVIGVAICFVVFYLRGKRGIPFYSALAVLQCIQPYMESSQKMAKQRTQGTMIGAFWGLIVLLVELYVFPSQVHNSVIGDLFIALAIGAVLYTTVLLNRKNVSYFSCVVFLSITMMHMTDRSPFVFVFNRVVDTLIGVFLAVLVNSIHFPRERNRDILFASGIDDALLNKKDAMTPYSKVELNRLIEDGANFTVSTMRTPAAIMEALSGIKFKLPIIAMDGAALFDMEKNTYLMTYTIPYEEAVDIRNYINQYNVNCFINVVLEDVLIIYYQKLENIIEKEMVDRLRKSPYRNYVNRDFANEDEVVYFMIIHEDAIIRRLYHGLKKDGYCDKYKILCYPSKDYPGYAYIKIYNKEATRKNMLDNLKNRIGLDKSISFGSIAGESDVLIQNADENEVVVALKKLYEPVKWIHLG